MTDSALFERVPREGGSLSTHKLAKADYRIDPETGCWEWLKFKLRGYGRNTAAGHSQYAHRAYYEVANGPVPPDHDVHHKCVNPGCVNPEHLEAVTQREHDIEHFLELKAGLTVEDVLEIRRRGRIMGVSALDVAEEFGIFWSTVYNYWSGDRRWKDLLGDEPGPAVPTDPCPNCGGEVDRTTGGPTNRRGPRTKKFCTAHCRSTYKNRRRGKVLNS